MPVTLINDTTIQTLLVVGPATVAEIDELGDAFRSAVASGAPTVRVDLSGLGKLDVTFLQLLVSLRATLARAGRSLSCLGLGPDHPARRQAAALGLSVAFDGCGGQR
ncbi:MAG TPA: STAS domain-containing protein [Spirochaetales bacterium]|nr:STAS domain-containing protein [Spirochaetales bacterium]HPM73648.1 STAS domain-containing protein [Spirochaetales bacterium]